MTAGSVAVVKLLLEHGADASAACDAGSPVMWAAGSGKSATLEALLQGGADPNTPGNANVTAALAASAAGTQFKKQCSHSEQDHHRTHVAVSRASVCLRLEACMMQHPLKAKHMHKAIGSCCLGHVTSCHTADSPSSSHACWWCIKLNVNFYM